MLEKMLAELREYLLQCENTLDSVEGFLTGPRAGEITKADAEGQGFSASLAKCAMTAKRLAEIAARVQSACNGDAPVRTL